MNKFVYNTILAILLVCTVIILYQVITNPLGEYNIIFPLIVFIGFAVLWKNKPS